ncbi:hypothetical protein [Caulobacter sp. DWR2-3-1b2]|uniref:hypothetical protein n=1 Tax=unclassified Caulobacter TaxID=2648921 RepID=UPI003CEE9108
MGHISICNLDGSAIDALKRCAVDHATSAEKEARQALAASVALERREIIARLDAVRAALGPQTGPSSLDLLRAERARDDHR